MVRGVNPEAEPRGAIRRANAEPDKSPKVARAAAAGGPTATARDSYSARVWPLGRRDADAAARALPLGRCKRRAAAAPRPRRRGARHSAGHTDRDTRGVRPARPPCGGPRTTNTLGYIYGERARAAFRFVSTRELTNATGNVHLFLLARFLYLFFRAQAAGPKVTKNTGASAFRFRAVEVLLMHAPSRIWARQRVCQQHVSRSHAARLLADKCGGLEVGHVERREAQVAAPTLVLDVVNTACNTIRGYRAGQRQADAKGRRAL